VICFNAEKILNINLSTVERRYREDNETKFGTFLYCSDEIHCGTYYDSSVFIIDFCNNGDVVI